MLAVSTDSPEESAKLHAKLGLSFPILSDPDLTAIDAYGVRHAQGNPMEGRDIARPADFLVDERGRIVWRELTANWRIRLDPQRVLDRLDALR